MKKYGKRRRRYRKRIAKKGYKKSFKRYRSLSAPFPYKMVTKLRYVDYLLTLDAAAASFATLNWRANDLYDPYASGFGHQPRGFDQWADMYKKFVVIGSRMTVQFASRVSASGQGCFVSVRVNTDPTTPTLISDVMEDRKVVSKYLPTDATRTLSIGYSHKKWKRSKPLTDVDAYCTNGASPQDVVYYQIMASAPSTAQDPQQIELNVRIDYIVVMFDPITPGES